ncbi:hypothetical protein CLAIMM_12084 [Cladophialophora immunda]|nr:hypothetical protein CLAIMM_12084 [Cladophialophora immunda]
MEYSGTPNIEEGSELNIVAAQDKGYLTVAMGKTNNGLPPALRISTSSTDRASADPDGRPSSAATTAFPDPPSKIALDENKKASSLGPAITTNKQTTGGKELIKASAQMNESLATSNSKLEDLKTRAQSLEKLVKAKAHSLQSPASSRKNVSGPLG